MVNFVAFFVENKEMRTIKLIWDFIGDDSLGTAEHYAIHLGEFAVDNNYGELPNGFEQLTASHAIAFMLVPEDKVFELRDLLLPQRAEVFVG